MQKKQSLKEIHRFYPHLAIKKGIQGQGVFSTVNVKKGEILFKMKGKILTSPTRTSVQVGKNKHIEDFMGAHVNHSCSPNAKVYKRLQAFISIKQIHKGDEITFDYNKNETHLAAPFICARCGKKIKGKDGLAKGNSHRLHRSK